MKIKKLLILLTSVTSLTTLNSCNNSKKLYSNLDAIVPYLHKITFNDYSNVHTDEFIEWIEEMFGTNNPDYANLLMCNFGCSDIRNGNLFGRNLDFAYSRMAEFVVKVKENKRKGRLASIGTAIHPYFTEEDVLKLEKSGTYSKELETLPCITSDGINEKGVVCAFNTAPLLDAGKFDHTNEGKEEIFLLYIVRFILDHATSASNAISLLNSCNITYPYEFAMEIEFEDSAHIMIADSKETYIVEFFDNKLVYTETDKISQANGNVMTNFYNNMSDDREKDTYSNEEMSYYKGYDKNAEGVERYQLLVDQYDLTKDLVGMFMAMKSVKATDAYLSPTEPNWPSDDVDQTIINNEKVYEKWSKGEGEYQDDPHSYPNIYKINTEILSKKDRDNSLLNDVWITTHTAVYDIKNQKIIICAQECYTIVNTYSLESF